MTTEATPGDAPADQQIRPADIFDETTSFEALGLSPAILQGIEALGFERPTKVQASVIPVALSGRDIMAKSKTGTGKTAAFGLPMLHTLHASPSPLAGLILVPTRELAVQVARELRELGRFTDLKITPIYGGQPMRVQADKLAKNPEIIVGTPGRVMDFHRRGQLDYSGVRYAVLDEVDRMLDIGFRDDIRRILGAIRQEHQTVFVSATISPEIDRLARQYLKDPEQLELAGASLTVSQVSQHYFSVQPWDKSRLLLHLLRHEDPALTLVFCRTKQTVDALARYLEKKGIDAHSIHGDMYQRKRNQVMDKLRAGGLRVLIASDLAARGIDVDGITHVINYDLPEDPEIYVHRIGRTARAGAQGEAWSFVSAEQGDLLTAIEMLTNVQIDHRQYDDFKPGPVPEAIALEEQRQRERRDTLRETASRVKVAPPVDSQAKDERMFPGGVAPKELPKKRMGGRLRSRRR